MPVPVGRPPSRDKFRVLCIQQSGGRFASQSLTPSGAAIMMFKFDYFQVQIVAPAGGTRAVIDNSTRDLQ